MDDIEYVKFSTTPLPAEPYPKGIYDWIYVSQESFDELRLYNHADYWSNEDGEFVMFRTVAPEPKEELEDEQWLHAYADVESTTNFGGKCYSHLRFTAKKSCTSKGDDIIGSANGDMSWRELLENYGCITVHEIMRDPKDNIINAIHRDNP